MKLLSVRIDGVRGIQGDEFDLGAVTVVTGANGAGKSTILGCVLFALTGRFPGLPAMSQGGAALMSRTPGAPKFRVSLRAVRDELSQPEEVLLTRAWMNGKGSVALADGKSNVLGKQAEAKILSLFGDVAFLSEALSPEGSIWGLSREKRKAWASTLCRSASGWTRDRLVKEVGPASDDWNPAAMDDVGAALDLNIARLQEAVRAAQAVARQAEGVVETVSGDDLRLPSKEDVQVLQQAFERELERVNTLTAQRRDLDQRRSLFDRHEANRRTLADEIDRLRASLSPDASPADLAADAERVEGQLRVVNEVDDQIVEIEIELSDARGRLSDLAARASAENTVSLGLAAAAAHSKCPTCGQQGTFEEAAQQAKARVEATQREVTAATAEVGALSRRYAALNAQAAQAKEAYVEGRVALAEKRQRIEAAGLARAAQAERLCRAEEQLASWPAGEPPQQAEGLDAELASAKLALAKARSAVESARSLYTLARERDAQREASIGARDEAERLKELLRRVIEARDKMLRESIEPLRVALKTMSSTAPDGGTWDAEIDGDALDLGLRRVDGVLVPAETLSSGERYRLTAALLVARSKLRRDQWVGLVFDGFEQVCPDDARVKTLSALAAMVQSEDVDNAIFAAATDAAILLPGATSIHLGTKE